MHRNVFKATYQESTGIVTRDQLTLKKESFDNMKLRKRIVMPLLVIFLLAPATYMVGVKMPLNLSDEKNNFYFTMIKYGTIFSGLIKTILIIWIVLSLLFLFQRQNFAKYAIDSFFVFLPFILAVTLSIFDLLFGASVAGVGLLGGVVLVSAGIIYIFSAIFNTSQDVKAAMYRIKRKNIPFRWNLFATVIAVVLTLGSSLIFRPEEFNLLLYIISFGQLVACALIALTSKYMVRMFFTFYYFAKYGEQYKQKFKITDEQWYGPHKAKRLAKKKGER